MGLPGPINRATGTVGSSSILPGWVGVDAAAEMERRLRLPVHVENDANLGALAEYVWGSGKGHSDVIYIKLSSGVGAGLLLGGRLHEGAGRHGRRDRPHARPAGHGDLPLRQPGLSRDRRLRAGHRRAARRQPRRAGLDAGAARADRRGRPRGGPPDRRGRAGRSVSPSPGLCNLINPDCVIIGGDLSAAGELITEPVLESIRRYAITSAAEQVSVVAGSAGRAGRAARRARPRPARRRRPARLARARPRRWPRDGMTRDFTSTQRGTEVIERTRLEEVRDV